MTKEQCAVCGEPAEAPKRIGRKLACGACVALLQATLPRARQANDVTRRLWSRRVCITCGRSGSEVEALVLHGDQGVCAACVETAADSG